MFKTDQINELFCALSKAQGEIENAKKDSENPYYKSKYADLAEVINVAKTPLSKNGLCVSQYPTYNIDSKTVTVITILGHTSGQYIQNELTSIADKMDIQTIGKLITYLRRYSYASIVGIAQEDDDGNDATLAQNKMQQKVPLPAVKKDILISEKQVFELMELIKITNTDIEKLLKYYKISKLNDLNECFFSEIKNNLKKKMPNSIPLEQEAGF